MRWDFSAIMVLFVVICGAIWALDAWVLAPRRRLAPASAGGRDGSGPGSSDAIGTDVTRAVSPGDRPPVIVEYAKSFFPVFLVVLLLRSFLLEPFRIPSNSMMPTLLTGDFIVVNKFVYGIRLPVLDWKVIDIDEPARGDVVVFRYPNDPSTPFIKRVVGLPGDRIGYFNKTVYVNGKPQSQRSMGVYEGKGSGTGMTGAGMRIEKLGSVEHQILLWNQTTSDVSGEWTVPPGHYFVLGDNRDNSRDSRYWGFVPEENLIGHAFAIWMNWDWGHGMDFGRVGRAIE